MKNNNLTPVQQFYNGRTIFVTGGSGFMGKVFILCYFVILFTYVYKRIELLIFLYYIKLGAN